MRLIDADALIAEMHNTILEDGEDRRTFYEVIERQPTIDAVPVIRCRDCQNWEHLLADDGYCYCPFVDHYTAANWFCADGERKQE